VRIHVLDANHDRVCHLPFARRSLVAAYVGDDDRAVADTQLRAVVLTDPQPLLEAERLGQPVDSLPHIGIDEHRNDDRRRYRPVVPHSSSA
jgi:hypothetical protein